MEPRTIGIEEELLLVDPATRQLSPRSQRVLKQATDHRSPTSEEDLDSELFRHQLETRTTPSSEVSELREHVVAQRRAAAEAAEHAGVVTIASGTSPTAGGTAMITRDDRYLAMVALYGEIASTGGICGMHVHVGVDSDEQGVAVIDRLVPWLPVLLAISANSPYAEGRDTHYESWRSQIWAQWPSAGPTERFGSLEAYEEVSRRLIDSGAALDHGMLYFDARLSVNNPTVEVRISDVCADPDDGILIAALVRALVMRFADGEAGDPGERGDEDGPSWRAEYLQAAHWRAARFGLSDRLLNPTTIELAPSRDVLALLVKTVRDQLEVCGDADFVHDGLERVLAGGGASRQRAAYERSGGDLAAVVDDLAVRTNDCWRRPDR